MGRLLTLLANIRLAWKVLPCQGQTFYTLLWLIHKLRIEKFWNIGLDRIFFYFINIVTIQSMTDYITLLITLIQTCVNSFSLRCSWIPIVSYEAFKRGHFGVSRYYSLSMKKIRSYKYTLEFIWKLDHEKLSAFIKRSSLISSKR